MHGHSWQSCCIEPWSNWLSCLGSQAWLTVAKAKIGWVNQRQINIGCIGWMSIVLPSLCNIIKITIRSHVERPGVKPLCWGRLCANKVGLILERMTFANTFPGTESKVIPAVRSGSFPFIQWNDYTLVPFLRDDFILPYTSEDAVKCF